MIGEAQQALFVLLGPSHISVLNEGSWTSWGFEIQGCATWLAKCGALGVKSEKPNSHKTLHSHRHYKPAFGAFH